MESKKYTILFVDDNPVILQTVKLAFKKEPYNILLAESGAVALPLVERHHPCVIVTDLRMPEMNGLEFLRQARRISDRWVGMIFTAYLDLESVMQAVNTDFVWRYVLKPWKDSREILLAVRNAVQYYQEREARRRVLEQLARTERIAALGRLVTGFAHQFNNINVGILGYAQMARLHSSLPDEVDDCLTKICIFAHRSSEVIKDLLAFSDQSSRGFVRGNITQAAREAVSLLAKDFDGAGIVLAESFTATADIEMDYGMVRQMILNLLVNALHATLGKEEKQISIETGTEGEQVFVRVTDNGCGILPEHLEKIFDPFFSTKGAHAAADSPAAALRDVGLGLSLSQTVAASHGGQITVESAPGTGSSFTLWLPAGSKGP